MPQNVTNFSIFVSASSTPRGRHVSDGSHGWSAVSGNSGKGEAVERESIGVGGLVVPDVRAKGVAPSVHGAGVAATSPQTLK